ncbi:hypothetical protein LU11_gp306 [Pseudomonas phage Lu11]|uniref:hypothetical protein n=1 Tax=Pseudomonas phage Lu11 TaxID=1161927 RepID=UPI00025F185C|nr:hypothetical protein LU11_gp306 [Pseudomonas phage Lu11]AFH14837.1 hypothetical protein Lu11_0299 [Pseudomonas phage Lu11]
MLKMNNEKVQSCVDMIVHYLHSYVVPFTHGQGEAFGGNILETECVCFAYSDYKFTVSFKEVNHADIYWQTVDLDVNEPDLELLKSALCAIHFAHETRGHFNLPDYIHIVCDYKLSRYKGIGSMDVALWCALDEIMPEDDDEGHKKHEVVRRYVFLARDNFRVINGKYGGSTTRVMDNNFPAIRNAIEGGISIEKEAPAFNVDHRVQLDGYNFMTGPYTLVPARETYQYESEFAVPPCAGSTSVYVLMPSKDVKLK